MAAATVTAPPPARAPAAAIVCPPPLDRAAFGEYRRRAIFSFGKLDPQCGDVCVLAPFPLVLAPETWAQLAREAEALDSELRAAEAELLARPKLHRRLGVPAPIRRALRAAAADPPDAGPRFVRYDFHPAAEGWRISEVNCDVPGGFLEATALAQLMSEHHTQAIAAGDPTEALAASIAGGLDGAPEPTVALAHATAYTDDRQVMAFLRRALAAHGVRGVLCAPDHLLWSAGRAVLCADLAPDLAAREPDLLLRFFPAEWLANLGRAANWQAFFAAARTPQSNPPTSLLTQSKRFPLVWDDLSPRLATWRRLLPETREPRARPARAELDAWVLKPALGRVGDMVAIRGVSAAGQIRRAERLARLAPRSWVAQRRFEAVPVETADGPRYPCIGVFVIDGRAAGAYGRLAPRPLIDAGAQDIAVLVARGPADAAPARAEPNDPHQHHTGTLACSWMPKPPTAPGRPLPAPGPTG